MLVSWGTVNSGCGIIKIVCEAEMRQLRAGCLSAVHPPQDGWQGEIPSVRVGGTDDGGLVIAMYLPIFKLGAVI